MIINKNKFKSRIGTLYYLWKDDVDGIKVLFLGNKSQAFCKYIKKIESSYRCQDKPSFIKRESKDIETEIIKYLEGKISYINFRIEFLTGTQFQRNIWNKVISMPYGKTVSYKKLADLAGYKKAWRAVGSALKENPIMLIVPCHRVVKSDGVIGKFAGGGKVKRFLFFLFL